MKKFIILRKINKISLILIVLGIGVGLLITAQWRTKNLRVSNPVIPYVALLDTRDDLTVEQNDLKKQIAQLQRQIKDVESELKKESQSKKKIEELEKYKEQAGFTEIKGDGVVITLDDAHNKAATIDSITHAADLRDIVNFLWSVGAKAISINGERIVFNTSIDCIINTILINSTKTTPPYTISVIGEGKKLSQSLKSEENLKDIHKRVKNEGLVFEVSEVRNIVIPAYDGSFPIKFTKIK